MEGVCGRERGSERERERDTVCCLTSSQRCKLKPHTLKMKMMSPALPESRDVDQCGRGAANVVQARQQGQMSGYEQREKS